MWGTQRHRREATEPRPRGSEPGLIAFGDLITFLDGFSQITGTDSFVNSGVGLRRELDPSKLDFEGIGEDFQDFFRQGPRIIPTMLAMPSNCLDQGPHCHPGGEFSYVVEGEYFDADMDGGVIETYPAGRVIFYRQGSTHRPLSSDGATILYIPFDGIVFGKDPEDLARKMVKVGTAAEAVEYALEWMVPDASARRKLLDSVLDTSA